jgi:hypothetical protein
MKHVHHKIGKYNIHTFDDVFLLNEREKFYMFFSGSMFKLGWGDSVEVHEQHKKFLHSNYSADDVSNSNFFTTIQNKQAPALHDLLNNRKLETAVVNLSTPSNSYQAHTHDEGLSLLYYVNLRWQEEWAGETLFFSEDLKDVVFTSPYTPGRIILFDNPLPHSIRAQSMAGPQYRFTFASFLE